MRAYWAGGGGARRRPRDYVREVSVAAFPVTCSDGHELENHGVPRLDRLGQLKTNRPARVAEELLAGADDSRVDHQAIFVHGGEVTKATHKLDAAGDEEVAFYSPFELGGCGLPAT